jgi:uncharacterized membrane protein YqjE
MSAPDSETGARPGGLLQSLRRVLSTLVEILHDRLELIITELEEQKLRAAGIAVASFLALFFLALGIIFGTLAVVVAFWENYRLAVLTGFAVLYLALGAIAGLVWRARSRARPRLLATTLAELVRDRDELRPPS